MRLILSALYNTLASWQRNTFGDVTTHPVAHCKSNNHPFIHSDTCTISKYFPKTYCSIFSTGQRPIHSKAGWGRGLFDWCWLTTHQQLNGQASHIASLSITSRLPHKEDDRPSYRRRRRFVWHNCRVELKCDGTRCRTGGEWRGNWRMEWVASTLHTISEHGVSSITTADAHTSAASSRLNW